MPNACEGLRSVKAVEMLEMLEGWWLVLLGVFQSCAKLPESLGHKMPETTCQLTVESKAFKKTLVGTSPAFPKKNSRHMRHMTLGDNLLLKGLVSCIDICIL